MPKEYDYNDFDDINRKAHSIMVRDAIIECFYRAHLQVLERLKEIQEFETEQQFEQSTHIGVAVLVRNRFEAIGADFTNPTKEDLIRVCDMLAYFASSFRPSTVVNKEHKEMIQFVKKLEGISNLYNQQTLNYHR